MVIKEDGTPVSALIDAKLVERIRPMQGRFDSMRQRIDAGFSKLPQSEGLVEIDAATQFERAQFGSAS